MLYIITQAGAPIGSVSEAHRAAHNPCGEGYETEAALQFFFNVSTTDMQHLADGEWLVGGERVHVEIVS